MAHNSANHFFEVDHFIGSLEGVLIFMTDVEAATESYEVYKEMQKEATEDHLFIH